MTYAGQLLVDPQWHVQEIRGDLSTVLEPGELIGRPLLLAIRPDLLMPLRRALDGDPTKGIRVEKREDGGRLIFFAKPNVVLPSSDERLRLFFEGVRDYALFQLDPEGVVVAWNEGAERLLGWSAEEILGKPGGFVFTPEDIAGGRVETELNLARTTGRAEDERWHIRRDGTRFFANGMLMAVRDPAGVLLGFAKIMRDSTQKWEQEERLRASIAEKSLLVHEIHHRVKNNLQVIVSLLSLQANHLGDAKLVDALRETESRVRSIAKIHERLFSSPDFAEIEFGQYLTELVRELLALHADPKGGPRLTLEVEDMVLRIEQAVPLGLIANELILNSIKHGLPNRSGVLTVKLNYVENDSEPTWGHLEISDNGEGLPEPLELEGAETLGLRLVGMLVRQVRGRLERKDGGGARLSVYFPLQEEDCVTSS